MASRSLLLLLFALTAGAIGCGGSDVAAPSPIEEDPGFGQPVGPDRRLNTDPAGAELSLVPQLACDGDAVYAVWYDRRNGNLDIRFNRSEDGGRTWLAQDVRLDSGPPGTAGSVIPRLCRAGSALYVVWYDDRNGAPDIYFNRSLDGGRTWLPFDRRLDTDPAGAGASREPRIACDGARVYVAWSDQRSGDWDVRFNRSLDGGDSWLAQDVRVDRAPGPTRAELPSVACDGATVVVTWRDERDGGSDVYVNRSQDGGASFAAADRRLNTDGPAAGITGRPRIAWGGDRVVVVWPDRRDGGADIRCNVSGDRGSTWRVADRRLDTDEAGAHDSLEPDLCLAGDAVHVVWSDERNGAADVYGQRSTDGGATWLAQDVRLDDDLPGVSEAIEPRVACTGARVCVVWRDDRGGRYDVFLRHSPDGGATWVRPETRLDTDPAGSGHSLSPRVCCEPNRAYVVWYDQRDGPGDIYFNRVALPGAP